MGRPGSPSQSSPLSTTTWAASPPTTVARLSPLMLKATTRLCPASTLLERLAAHQCTEPTGLVPTLFLTLSSLAVLALRPLLRTTNLERRSNQSLTTQERQAWQTLTSCASRRVT